MNNFGHITTQIGLRAPYGSNSSQNVGSITLLAAGYYFFEAGRYSKDATSKNVISRKRNPQAKGNTS